jgi:hypothetical protein
MRQKYKDKISGLLTRIFDVERKIDNMEYFRLEPQGQKIEDLQKQIDKLIENFNRVARIAHCPEHEYEYNRTIEPQWFLGIAVSMRFIFKCKNCGKEITKTASMLDKQELAALKALGVIGQEEK